MPWLGFFVPRRPLASPMAPAKKRTLRPEGYGPDWVTKEMLLGATVGLPASVISLSMIRADWVAKDTASVSLLWSVCSETEILGIGSLTFSSTAKANPVPPIVNRT